SLVPPSQRPAKVIPRGAMPARVHVAEDYDLDIEKRWWMSGKAETRNLPPGSKRACRGVLTHDFDDLLGNPKAMYTAVVFNPVPGEKRPFPAKVHFTGLFDTGKQGKEWPGDFGIVPHKAPLTWKAAKSVANAESGEPWSRVGLRGERPLGETTHLRFRYHLTG